MAQYEIVRRNCGLVTIIQANFRRRIAAEVWFLDFVRTNKIKVIDRFTCDDLDTIEFTILIDCALTHVTIRKQEAED